MNLLNSAKLTSLKRQVEHLAVMMEIKKRTDEEDALALLLLAVLNDYYDNGDIDAFMSAFLATLRTAYEDLDPDGEYADVIDEELATQEEFLKGFADGLEGGDVNEAQARARVNQYSTSLGKVKERIKIEKLDPQTRGMWQINPLLENCQDCVDLKGSVHTMKWFLENHIPKDGNTTCGQHCGCNIKLLD
jgi:hypothetical protein